MSGSRKSHIMRKFENVDIIRSLRAIMETNTRYYQSDFDIDVKNLTQAAKKRDPEDKRYLWMCRPAGTWCLRERNVFIKETGEHCTFCYYAEHMRDRILVFAVELVGIEKCRVMGSLYELDYQKHYEHVRNVSVDQGNTRLIYENGERIQEAGKRVIGNDDPDFGRFLSFEVQPKDPDALCRVLQDEKYHRDHFKCGDINAYIKKMSV